MLFCQSLVNVISLVAHGDVIGDVQYISRRNAIYFLREKLYLHGLLSC